MAPWQGIFILVKSSWAKYKVVLCLSTYNTDGARWGEAGGSGPTFFKTSINFLKTVPFSRSFN